MAVQTPTEDRKSAPPDYAAVSIGFPLASTNWSGIGCFCLVGLGAKPIVPRAGSRYFAPIPGTRRLARVEENTAADSIGLTATQLERLDNLTPAAAARHDDANMATIDH